MKRLRITVNGVSYEVEVEVLQEDGAESRRTMATPPVGLPAPQAPAPQSNTGSEEANVLTSPIAGIIKEIRVSPGDTVRENDPLVVIEAMKMNTNVASPVAGTIRAVRVQPGDGVRQGQPLLEFA